MLSTKSLRNQGLIPHPPSIQTAFKPLPEVSSVASPESGGFSSSLFRLAARKLGVLLGVCLVATLLSTSTFAGEISIAPQASWYQYKEPGLMKVYGPMYGVSVSFLNTTDSPNPQGQLRGRFDYMRSRTEDLTYDGAFMDGTPYKYKGDTFWFFDTMVAGGLEDRVAEKFSVAPYLGLGWRNHVDKKDPEPGDYKRKQTYLYLPIGIDWKIFPTRGLELSFNTELDVLLRGKNTTYLGGEAMEFAQNSGYGLRFSTKLEYNFGKAGIFVEPFFRYWNIADSETKCYYLPDYNATFCGLEPKNNTREFGMKIGVSF